MKWFSNRRLKINGRDSKNVIKHEVHTKKLTIFRGPASNYDKNCCCIKTVANAVSCGINLSQTYGFVKKTTQFKFSWMKTHPWSFLRSMILHHLGLSFIIIMIDLTWNPDLCSSGYLHSITSLVMNHNL